MDSVQMHLTQALGDPSIKVWLPGPGAESPESPPTPQLLATVEEITKTLWPEAIVLPMMSAVASDSVYTRIGGIPSYGIDGSWEDLDDARAHGVDERIGVEVYDQELEFTYRLMKAISAKK